MKKLDIGTLLVLLFVVVFTLGIIFNTTWLFIIGLAGIIVTIAIELDLFSKSTTDNGDSDSDQDDGPYEVNEAEVKNNVLYLH